MSSPTYRVRVLKKQLNTAEIEVVSMQLNKFGSDREFAWKLLEERVCPSVEGSEIELAKAYIHSVTLSPLQDAVITERKANLFHVRPLGKKPPRIVYTIVVKNASLLNDVTKGPFEETTIYPEEREVALENEVGAIELLSPTDLVQHTAISETVPKSSPSALMDFCEEFVKIASGDDRFVFSFKQGINQLCHRRVALSDDDLENFLNRISSAPGEDDGRTSQAAAFISLERWREKREDSAKRFLDIAIKHFPENEMFKRNALQGLIPAWWRSGNVSQGDAAYETISQQLSPDMSLWMAALGGQTKRVTGVISKPTCTLLVEGDQLHRIGIELFRDWDEAGLWVLKVRRPDYLRKLALDFCEIALEQGEPEKLLELILNDRNALIRQRHSDADFLEVDKVVAVLLQTVENKKLDLAVGFAQRIAEKEDPQQSLAVAADILAESLTVNSLPFSVTELQDEIHRKFSGAKVDEELAESALLYSSDKELATRILKSQLNECSIFDSEATTLIRLVDLGKKDIAESNLQQRFAKLEKQKAADRDPACRSLTYDATILQCYELAMRATLLPTSAYRLYAAVHGCYAAAIMGDWSMAYTFLMKIPDAYNRTSAAREALRLAESAFMNGPRALTMRSLTEEKAEK